MRARSLQPLSEVNKARIQAALDEGYGTHDLSDIEAGLQDGSLLLLEHPDCTIVLEPVQHPRLKALHIFLVGGSLEAFRSLDPRIVAIAKRLNCSHITGGGRLGFGPKMKDLGYRAKWAMFVKETA